MADKAKVMAAWCELIRRRGLTDEDIQIIRAAADTPARSRPVLVVAGVPPDVIAKINGGTVGGDAVFELEETVSQALAAGRTLVLRVAGSKTKLTLTAEIEP